MKVHYMKFLLVMLGYMISNVAFGHDFEAVNGDVVIYYDIISDIDKTVKVTYKGNYSEEVYYEYSGNVSIPQTVNYNGITYTVISLGDEAFYWCSSLTSVLIPNSIISIGEGCFNKCTNLTSVEIPNSVTSIGVNAFRSCSNLTSVEIGNSVTSIGSSSFEGCSSLASIEIPNSVTSIGNNAFYGTVWFNNQSDGVVYAGKVAYKYKGTMPSGTVITLKNGTLGIGENAFSGRTNLTGVEIPLSISKIGDNAFRGCSGLSCIIVDEDNEYYDSRGNCNAIIETSTNTLIVGCKNSIIPNSVTCIGNNAFSGCSSLTSIEMPISVTSIGNYAFSNCSGLTSVEIGNSVTTIGDNAFSYCSNLASIFFPKSVTSIGSNVFWDCYALTSVVISNSVNTIGDFAFRGCLNLTSVEIPNSVTSIGDLVFYDCI